MAKETVAVLGGRGMLGADLSRVCREHGNDVKVLDLPEFDITNQRHLTDALGDARTVVNCAAYTDVERAESEYELAYKVNAEAVGRMGWLAKAAGIWVLHISTDFVFDGTLNRPYIETDKPNPINAYGRTKLAGEKLLAESGCRSCIMRIEWTYGKAGDNFITKLISSAKQCKQLRIVDDQIGSPTATAEVAKAACVLLAKEPEGIFHFASAGYVSRFDVARFVCKRLNIDVDLQRCKSVDYKTAAKRPLNSRFCCDKIRPLLDEPIRRWQEPLEQFLGQL